MKEFTLQDLLHLADAPAHDGICDFWNQKTIHYLVVFTSTNEDFEIIGVGPTLPITTLDDAGRHLIPGKQPEFYVKCPAAIAGRIQPKFAPTQLGTRPTVLPTIKGRTTAPFMRKQLKLGPKTDVAEPLPPVAAPPAEAPKPKIELPKPKLEPKPNPEPPAPDLAQRLALLAVREQELSAREALLKEREAALAAAEEKFLERSRKSV